MKSIIMFLILSVFSSAYAEEINFDLEGENEITIREYNQQINYFKWKLLQVHEGMSFEEQGQFTWGFYDSDNNDIYTCPENFGSTYTVVKINSSEDYLLYENGAAEALTDDPRCQGYIGKKTRKLQRKAMNSTNWIILHLSEGVLPRNSKFQVFRGNQDGTMVYKFVLKYYTTNYSLPRPMKEITQVRMIFNPMRSLVRAVTKFERLVWLENYPDQPTVHRYESRPIENIDPGELDWEDLPIEDDRL